MSFQHPIFNRFILIQGSTPFLKLIILLLVHFYASTTLSGQTYNKEKGLLIWDFPGYNYDPRFEIKVVAGSYSMENQTAALYIRNISPNELWYNIEVIVSTYCASSAKATFSKTLKPGEDWGGSPWFDGFAADKGCTEAKVYGKTMNGRDYLSVISRVNITILEIRDITAENKLKELKSIEADFQKAISAGDAKLARNDFNGAIDSYNSAKTINEKLRQESENYSRNQDQIAQKIKAAGNRQTEFRAQSQAANPDKNNLSGLPAGSENSSSVQAGDKTQTIGKPVSETQAKPASVQSQVTNMSEPVGLKNSNGSVVVYQQNGNYYAKHSDGRVEQITREYFDQVHAISKRNSEGAVFIPGSPTGTGYQSPSSAAGEIAQGLERGQEISDAVMPLAENLVNAWNERAERQKKEWDEIIAESIKKSNALREYQRKETERLNSWETFRNEEYIVKIPMVMESPAPAWNEIINTKGLTEQQIFGLTPEESKQHKTMFKVFGRIPLGLDILRRTGQSLVPLIGLIAIKDIWSFHRVERKLKKGFFEINETPPTMSPYYSVLLYGSYDPAEKVEYKPGNFLDRYGKVKTNLIYDEDNRLIGLNWPHRSSEYHSKIRSFASNNRFHFLRPDYHTFIFKNIVFYVGDNGTTAYDLNTIRDRFLIEWPSSYKEIEVNSGGQYIFPFLGVGFKSVQTLKNELHQRPNIRRKGRDFIQKLPVYYRFEQPVLKRKDAEKLNLRIDEARTKRLENTDSVVVLGVVLGRILKDSPAEKAGLQTMDIVTEINGIPVSAPYQMQWVIHGYVESRQYNVAYIRNGEKHQTHIKLP